MKALNIIVVADIFGKSVEFEKLCQQIELSIEEPTTVKFHLIGPYQQQPENFTSEQQAYQYFIEHVGLENYSEILLSLLNGIEGPKVLIGFSVGGSAIWQAMPDLISHNIHHAICYYSSQIRHMTEQPTTVPTSLIFPKSEASFSVDELISVMQYKPHVNAEQCSFQHGFLNELSNNYDVYGRKEHVRKIIEFIKRSYLK